MLRRSCSVRAQVSRVCFRSLACSLGSSCATLLDQCLRVLTPAQPAQRVAAPRVPIRRSSTAFHVLDGHVETNTPDFKVRSSSPPPRRAPSAHLADQLERDEQTHEPPQRHHRTDSEGCVHCGSKRAISSLRSRSGGGAKAMEKHTARQKLPPRQRIDRLIDPGFALRSSAALNPVPQLPLPRVLAARRSRSLPGRRARWWHHHWYRPRHQVRIPRPECPSF